MGDGKLIVANMPTESTKSTSSINRRFLSMTGNRRLIEDVGLDFVDSVGMFATTRQTTVDVRSVSPVLTSGTHFLSISGSQHQ